MFHQFNNECSYWLDSSSVSSSILTISVTPIPHSSALVVSGVLLTRVLAHSLLVTVSVLVPLSDRHVVVQVNRIVALIPATISVLICIAAVVIFIAVRLLIVVLLKLNLSTRRLLNVVLVPDTICAISLNLLVDVLKPLLNHIIILVHLRLALALVATHVHCTTVSVRSILNFVDLCSWRGFIILTVHRRLLHHNLVFVLLVLVLEVTPFCQDFHSLNILNSRQLFSIVFVATQCVQVNLFAETFVLVLHDFKDVIDLLTVEYFLIIHACN